MNKPSELAEPWVGGTDLLAQSGLQVQYTCPMQLSGSAQSSWCLRMVTEFAFDMFGRSDNGCRPSI